MTMMGAIHVLAFIGVVWGLYFLDLHVTRRMREAQALLDKAIYHRRIIREALLLSQYGARDEAVQLINEAFEDEPA